MRHGTAPCHGPVHQANQPVQHDDSMSNIETEEVDFTELVIGDVVFSNDQQRQGTITELHPDFSQVSLDDGTSPSLPARVTILKRS